MQTRRNQLRIFGTGGLLCSLVLGIHAPVVAQTAPQAKPFERFEGSVLEPDEWTDGDSFRVRLRTVVWKHFGCILWKQPNYGRTRLAQMSKPRTSALLGQQPSILARKRKLSPPALFRDRLRLYSLASSLRPTATLRCRHYGRRKRFGRTAGEKRFGAHLWDAHTATGRARLPLVSGKPGAIGPPGEAGTDWRLALSC
jgi:hypothetical protein